MVFEKITIFEPHLEGARFGPTLGEHEEAENTEAREHVDTNSQQDESDGRSRVLTLVVASVAVSLVATVLARRYLGGDDEFEQYELEESVEEPAE